MSARQTIPRGEHPNPQCQREGWLNLNGSWEFAIDSARNGLEAGWQTGREFDQRILVPFPPESELSGINRTEFLGAVWYRRHFKVPEACAGQRVLLHIGAADFDTRVWVNGEPVGRHLGGYSPICADITDSLRRGDNEVVVYCEDDSRAGRQPSGKQSPRLHSFACYYTRVTGIWQTVWLEAVSAEHIVQFTILPSARDGRALITVELSQPVLGGTVQVAASLQGKEVASDQASGEGTRATLCLTIPDPQAWEPGSPTLYDLGLRLLRKGEVVDEVSSYFGLRDVDIEGRRILLNGKSVFLRMILDQGYYPGGVYTPESDEVQKRDIEMSQSMGFTGARLHQKVFEPRFLYWADKLGYLLCGEMGDWGLDFGNAEGRENFVAEWLQVLRRDINHPSIIIWTPFNESRRGVAIKDRLGALQHHLYHLTKAVDPSRPVIDSSGYVHFVTDIYDVHNYTQDPEQFAGLFEKFGETGAPEDAWRNASEHDTPYAGQPYFVSEFGGTWWVDGEAQGDAWGYGDRPQSKQEFLERFRALAEVLLRNPRIAGFCYTQLTDIEQETNGLLTFDRKYKLAPAEVRAILSQPAEIEREGG